MRLVAQIYVTVPADVVRRNPTLLEKLKRGLGGAVNLETNEVQNQLEATAVVDAARRALAKLGVSNALSLVIDDTVIFQDSDGRAGDLPDLVLALSEHASVFGRGFRELRLAAEHEEAGLHLVIETRARTRHRREHPAAVVSVGGRLRALEPRSGETAEAYRARVEPLTGDKALFETGRLAFESFVSRLEGALRAAMPEAVVEEKRAEARLVKGPEGAGRAVDRPPPREPTHPAYDPFLFYYPSPMSAVLDAMVFTSFMHMLMPPPFLVVSPLGAPYGHAGDIQANPELAATDLDSGAGGFDSDGDGLHDHGAGDGAGHGDADLSSYGDQDQGGGGFDDGGGGWDGGGWDGGGFDGGGLD